MVSETREIVTPSGPCPTGPVKLGRRLFDRRRQLQPHLRMPACPGVIIVSDRRVADDLGHPCAGWSAAVSGEPILSAALLRLLERQSHIQPITPRRST